ncbi:helix-turn-helix domain-containing protein [Streptomyces eurythermus]|uniref:helix-turn-helix domain-containing protein n=1 Tax=Streptomyces eurythermus TaxID=42237 RepID=UPI0036FF0FFF
MLLGPHPPRPGRSGRRVAGLLGRSPADRPESLEALRVRLGHGRVRRATAHALGPHPDTVDNRLARIAERTGTGLSSHRSTATAIAPPLRETDT